MSKDNAPGQNKPVTITINATKYTVTGHQITFEEIVKLAFPGTSSGEESNFTVEYSYPTGQQGTLVAGQHTHLKEGMDVTATPTNRS